MREFDARSAVYLVQKSVAAGALFLAIVGLVSGVLGFQFSRTSERLGRSEEKLRPLLGWFRVDVVAVRAN